MLLLCGHPESLNFILSFIKWNYHFSIIELFPYDLHIHVTRLRKYQLFLHISVIINKGYYITARRYEISLRVLKNISQVSAANQWNIFSTREEKFRISRRQCTVLFIIQTPMKYQTISLFKIVFSLERRNLLCSHSNSDISLVKITCYFHMSRYHVFERKLTWFSIHGAYI